MRRRAGWRCVLAVASLGLSTSGEADAAETLEVVRLAWVRADGVPITAL